MNMYNKEMYNEIIREKKEILLSQKFHDKVAVEIYGKIVYFCEAEVRTLQVMAARKATISDEAFEEFAKNVIVYSNRWKRTSTHTMHFRKDGKFSDEFDEGFYDICSNLAFEIL